ncbi:OLC1v1032117C1 [Oldenlandia corymbosa var. corymbosa]|uniref:OLC1v1032117C1 n=1 Tax=Oldenlandia corymbosa var. corymbosa TaxID=529605 RepID=A0AAV1CL19_OLDCO|nr:OLC1v1032117C1 [Oldenlandia corymbosa var. corymbosa]
MGYQGGNTATGVRFKPTRQELISLLRHKVSGKEVSSVTDSVLEKSLYGGEGFEPWNVFSGIDDDNYWGFYDESVTNDTRRVIYVITTLSRKSAKKMSRTAGCGTWELQTKRETIKNYNGDKIEGSMRMLKYVVDYESSSTAIGKGYWYMHEYNLSEETLKELGFSGTTQYVICRVIKDPAEACAESSPKTRVSKKRKIDNYNQSEVQEDRDQGTKVLNYNRGTVTSQEAYCPVDKNQATPANNHQVITSDDCHMEYSLSVQRSGDIVNQPSSTIMDGQSCGATESSFSQSYDGLDMFSMQDLSTKEWPDLGDFLMQLPDNFLDFSTEPLEDLPESSTDLPEDLLEFSTQLMEDDGVDDTEPWKSLPGLSVDPSPDDS